MMARAASSCCESSVASREPKVAKAIEQEMATPAIRRDGRACEHTGRARERPRGTTVDARVRLSGARAQGDMWRSSCCATGYTTERRSS